MLGSRALRDCRRAAVSGDICPLRRPLEVEKAPRSSWRRPKIGFAPVDEIETLELRIEELREAIERSRRLMLAGQASAVVGPAMFVCFVLGLIDFSPVRMIVGIALAIGGLVLTGSSRASTQQLMLSLKRTEEERSGAIDTLELVQVQDRA